MRAQLFKGEASTYMWKISPDEKAAGGLHWFGKTEDAGAVAVEGEADRRRRFRILSFGEDGDNAFWIADMELIWAVAMGGGVHGAREGS